VPLAAGIIAGHPANAGFRRHREAGHPGVDPVRSPEEVVRPYDSLGTHPDLVARLWDELAKGLPRECRLIFFGGPALVHPGTGILFGFAEGTHTYALRLPEPERLEAQRQGAARVVPHGKRPSFDLNDIGSEWIFCRWYKEEETWCRAAYDFAGIGS